MVMQGNIIKLNFDPQSGREQAGYRPAVVISNDVFNARTNMANRKLLRTSSSVNGGIGMS